MKAYISGLGTRADRARLGLVAPPRPAAAVPWVPAVRTGPRAGPGHIRTELAAQSGLGIAVGGRQPSGVESQDVAKLCHTCSSVELPVSPVATTSGEVADVAQSHRWRMRRAPVLFRWAFVGWCTTRIERSREKQRLWGFHGCQRVVHDYTEQGCALVGLCLSMCEVGVRAGGVCG